LYLAKLPACYHTSGEVADNLDGKTKLELIELLGKLNVEQGTTIVIVTHDSQVASMGRMLFVSDGKLLAKENREHT